MKYADSLKRKPSKGYLHWKKEDIGRALRSSKRTFSLSTKPYFVKRL